MKRGAACVSGTESVSLHILCSPYVGPQKGLCSDNFPVVTWLGETMTTVVWPTTWKDLASHKSTYICSGSCDSERGCI